MIEKLIAWSIKRRELIALGAIFLLVAGALRLRTMPVDAIPDLSDTQVIVYTDYPGQAPQVVENQVTYPLVTTFLSVPKVKVVRGQSMFSSSFVYVIFQDGTDLYWARSRVLEYLSATQSKLPAGAKTRLGPDATGVGWVYQYAVAGPDYAIRGLGYFRGAGDIENVAVGAGSGRPVRVGDVAQVTIGPDLRLGIAERNGQGEAVGGVVVMRYGENALRVINGVNQRIAEITPALPAGVRIVPTYDRSDLIHGSIRTLWRTPIEESIRVG